MARSTVGCARRAQLRKSRLAHTTCMEEGQRASCLFSIKHLTVVLCRDRPCSTCAKQQAAVHIAALEQTSSLQRICAMQHRDGHGPPAFAHRSEGGVDKEGEGGGVGIHRCDAQHEELGEAENQVERGERLNEHGKSEPTSVCTATVLRTAVALVPGSCLASNYASA